MIDSNAKLRSIQMPFCTEIDGEFTVKRLLLRPRPALEPVSDSPEFRTLYPENICIFGVVTHVIHRTRELR
ncbi:DNA polymerase V subunit UmuD [Shigella sonnei]|nr:DNA polymerase V subunit UmuD [Shigella sonnei]